MEPWMTVDKTLDVRVRIQLSCHDRQLRCFQHFKQIFGNRKREVSWFLTCQKSYKQIQHVTADKRPVSSNKTSNSENKKG